MGAKENTQHMDNIKSQLHAFSFLCYKHNKQSHRTWLQDGTWQYAVLELRLLSVIGLLVRETNECSN